MLLSDKVCGLVIVGVGMTSLLVLIRRLDLGYMLSTL
jgi:hypothetical protein